MDPARLFELIHAGRASCRHGRSPTELATGLAWALAAWRSDPRSACLPLRDVRGPQGHSLATAAAESGLPGMVRALATALPPAAGVPNAFDACDGRGRTPACCAAARGSVAVLMALHDAGADLGRPDAFGQTPLMRAVSIGHSVAVGHLLRVGAVAREPGLKAALRAEALGCHTLAGRIRAAVPAV